MWSYLVCIALGFCFALLRGASFFPALRQAQFQFAHLLQSNDVSGYAPFVRGVVRTWPDRLAAYPVAAGTVFAIAWAFAIPALSFRLWRRRPRGLRLEESYAPGTRAATRLLRARELAGFDGPLFERSDAPPFAAASGGAVFLPRSLTQRLDRKLLENASMQVAFVIRHETIHSSTSDNLLWTFGPTLTALLTGVAGLLIASPIIYAIVGAIPNHWVALAPAWVWFAIVGIVAAAVLAYLGSAIAGLLPSMFAAREFFADDAATALVGPGGLPQVGTDDERRVGTSLEGWRIGIAPPDRHLHTIGLSPRTACLAASAISTWTVVRTAILMLDPARVPFATLALDLGSIVTITSMLLALPRRALKSRDYGVLPWLVAISLPVILMGLFAELRSSMASLNLPPVVPRWLAFEIGVPPLVVGCLTCAILRWRTSSTAVLAAVDVIPPQWPRIRVVAWRFLAMPALVSSYAAGGFVLLTAVTTLGFWTVGYLGPRTILIQNALTLPFELPFIALVAKNLASPTIRSAATEVIAVAVGAGLLLYLNYVITAVAMRSVPGNSGAPVDGAAVLASLEALPLWTALQAGLLTLVLLVLLGLSWWPRYVLGQGKYELGEAE